MTIAPTKSLTVVGAGPVGCVLSTLLAERGFDVTVFEKRPDLRSASLAGGRSINLVLTERGLSTLERIGLRDQVLELTVPVLGRMMHSDGGDTSFQPYGKDESECNHSVSRGQLNEFLLDAAEDAGVDIHFDCALRCADFDERTLRVDTADGDGPTTVDFDVVFGCDGAPSVLRQALVEAGEIDESVEFMDWGYKELLFPADDDGSWALDRDALHIWPRGDHFLMGLANLDGSFTGTLYLDRSGPESFESLDDHRSVRNFFERYYPNATPLLGDFVDEFLDNPTGRLGTVRAEPWYLDGTALLVGDAAHGIVPFFGQGLNCGLEDCLVLDELLDGADDFESVFHAFFERRKTNTEAIADMALENAVEMGDKVADDDFLLKKEVESLIEQRFADIYRSRYAMVMYSTNDYRAAFEAGEIQKQLLASLCDGVDDAGDVDLDEARRLIEDQLTPVYDNYNVDLDF